jgi:hypothetical protein
VDWLGFLIHPIHGKFDHVSFGWGAGDSGISGAGRELRFGLVKLGDGFISSFGELD